MLQQGNLWLPRLANECPDVCNIDVASARQQASLLVLPEALLARDDNDPHMSVKSAQTLDGGFLSLLLEESATTS